MDLSVVTVTFNSSACIGRCLAALRDHLPAAEVVVVDNTSEDGTQQIVRRAGVQLLQNDNNEGFGRATNRGVREASRGHVLFLNPDVAITHCDPARLTALLASQPLGLVGPKTATTGGVIGPQREPSLAHEWWEQTVGTLRPRELPRRPSKQNSRDRTWLSGAMLLARRDEFLGLGGFDPRFFLYYEDRDLAARYRKAGLPIRTTADLAGAHTQGASSASDDLRITPAGWAFLGWIEYLFLHRGERTARRTAVSALATLRGLEFAVSAGASLFRSPRLLRKQAQLRGLVAFLEREAAAQPEPDSFCPDARRLLAELR